MTLTPNPPPLATLRVEIDLVQTNLEALAIRDKLSPAAAETHHRLNRLLDIRDHLLAQARP